MSKYLKGTGYSAYQSKTLIVSFFKIGKTVFSFSVKRKTLFFIHNNNRIELIRIEDFLIFDLFHKTFCNLPKPA